MGAQVRYGTIAVGAYSAHQPGSHQRAFTDQYHTKWDRGGARSPRTWKDPNRWDSLWSFGCKIGGGDLEGYSVVLECGHGYEPFSCDGAGTQTLKWVLGRCEDASGVAISDAIVKVFRASDDLFCGQTTSLSDGSFMCPSSCVGVNVYITAYKVGAPDVGGRSVNTLTPTNIDGT